MTQAQPGSATRLSPILMEQAGARLAALLQVRPGESQLVGLVILIFLVPSAGGAIGSPSIESLFLARVGVEFLPYMYIALGGVTFLTSMLITVLLSRVPRRMLYITLPGTLAATLALARVLVALDLRWVYPLLWVWMYLLWTLQALITWGLAGSLLNTRQAKRLFPLFGAGGILGIALGGLVTQPLVRLVGTENLLLAWSLSLLLTLGLVLALARRFGLRSRRRPRQRDGLTDALQKGLRTVSRSALLRWLSLAAALLAFLMMALAFPFSRAVAARFPNEDALTGFLGVLNGLITLAAFIAALLVANRLYARIGFMGALLVMPLIYVVGFGALLIAPLFAAFVGFRFMQMFWRQGLTDTARQAIFNIVPADRREQTRAFIDGVPVQAGVILSGLLLAFGDRFLRPQHMYLIGAVGGLAALTAVWQGRRYYSVALIDALRAGQPQLFFSEEEPFGGFQQDAAAASVVIEGIHSADPVVRRVSAEILGNMRMPSATDALVDALADDDIQVREASLRSLGQSEAASTLLEIAAHLADSEPSVRLQAIKALHNLTSYPHGLAAHVRPLLGDADPSVRAQAALVLLQAVGDEAAQQTLQAMAASSDPSARIHALTAFGEWGDEAGYDLVAGALSDDRPVVRQAAAAALAEIDAERCAVPLIASLGDADRGVREAVAHTLGKIGGGILSPVVKALDRPELEEGALLALGYLPVHQAGEALRVYAERKISTGRCYGEAWQAIRPHADGDRRIRLLCDSVRNAARREGKRALQAIGLRGDQDAVSLALENLESASAEQRANALEIVDSLAERDLVRPLLFIWEDGSPNPQGTNSPDPIPYLLALLGDADAWLRAAASFAAAAFDDPPIQAALAGLAEDDPAPLVRETALNSWKESRDVKTLPTLSMMERILFLRQVPLFVDLPPEELKQVASIAVERLFQDGETLTHQGDPGDELYIIAAGEVRVMKEDEGGAQRELARRKSGEYVGEMAIISDEPRMASLVATGEVRTLCIGQRDFEIILRERPETSLAVMRELCARLRERQPGEVGS